MKGGEKTGLLTPPGPLSEEAKQCVKKALEEMAGSLPFSHQPPMSGFAPLHRSP